MNELQTLFQEARQAARQIARLSDNERNEILKDVASRIGECRDSLLAANGLDLARMDRNNPLYDRLLLTPERLSGIAHDMTEVSTLPSPLGRIIMDRYLPNGLHLNKVSVPYGVIGVIYEARPNVTFDVFALCMKSGNVCVLKGGSDAKDSNKAAVALIQLVLKEHGISPAAATLLPATHEATGAMLNAVGYIDLCIPRGGKRLISFVRDNARVPVIETGAGVVNTYFDKDGNIDIARDIIRNAKTRRVSVCNALDCLLVHEQRMADMPKLLAPLAYHNVVLYADERAYAALDGHYPAQLLKHATAEHWGTEFMDYAMAVGTVDSIDQALRHIDTYGSGHSECIITDNEEAARLFQKEVDAACVYVNVPTSFTDGAQFGLGAEIGISTQKLGPRGPMGLEEMTTYKWLIEGYGQVRH